MLQVNYKFLINTSTYIIFFHIFLLKMSFCAVTGGISEDMKPLSTKRIKRIEKKKKKMAALIEITKLNEYDRANKCAQMTLKNATIESNFVEINITPKRLKTQEEIKSQNNIECIHIPENINANLDLSAKSKLEGEDFLKLKRLLRENTNKIRAQPTFRLRDFGESASLSVDIDNRIPLFVSDIQHLIMYSQIGHNSPYSPARWCQLDDYAQVIHTNVLIIENMSVYDFISNERLMPFLSTNYTHKLEIVNSSTYKTDLVQDLLMVPLTNTQMRTFICQYGSLESTVTESTELFDVIKNLFPIEETNLETMNKDLPTGDKFPRTQLLLSGWQLVEENFPLPIKGLMERKYIGYVLTKDKYEDVTNTSPMFGLDCEMCRTIDGELELTRVSIVNEKWEVFYEQLVKPEKKIVNYLTRYSGITPKMMKNVTKKLSEVQQDLRSLLPADAILVGQSLSNDLHALKMMHPYVIDTSVIYNITGDRSRKTKLQTLTREFLSEKIQQGHGHCSIEDSLASLKLVQHKLRKCLCYGDAVMSGIENHFRKHPQMGSVNYATSLLKQAAKLEKSVSVTALKDIVVKYDFFTNEGEEKQEKKIKCCSEKSNKNVVKRMCGTMKQHTLNIGHVRIANNQLEKDNLSIFKNIDKWIKQVFESTSCPALSLVIFNGSRDCGNGCCFIQLKRLAHIQL